MFPFKARNGGRGGNRLLFNELRRIRYTCGMLVVFIGLVESSGMLRSDLQSRGEEGGHCSSGVSFF